MTSYKILTEDWRHYMEDLNKPDSSKIFTPQMQNNEFFNFTRIIEDDMKTFLTSIAGNSYYLDAEIVLISFGTTQLHRSKIERIRPVLLHERSDGNRSRH